MPSIREESIRLGIHAQSQSQQMGAKRAPHSAQKHKPARHARVNLFFSVEYVEDRVAIHIIAGELNSAAAGRGRPRRHDDRLLTEDDDADAADTYDSDPDAAAYGGDEL